MLNIKEDYGDYLVHTTFPDLDVNIKEILQEEFDTLKEKTKNNNTTKEEVDEFIKKLNEFLYMETIAHKKVKTKQEIQSLYFKLISLEEDFKTFGFSSRFIDILTYYRIRAILVNSEEPVPKVPDINFNFELTNLQHEAIKSQTYEIKGIGDEVELPEIDRLFDKIHYIKYMQLKLPYIPQTEILSSKSGKKVNLLMYKELTKDQKTGSLYELQRSFTSYLKKQLFLQPKNEDNLYEYLITNTILELFKVRRLAIIINSFNLNLSEKKKEELESLGHTNLDALSYTLEVNKLNKVTLMYFLDSFLEISRETKGFIVLGLINSIDLNLPMYQLKNAQISLNIIKKLDELTKLPNFDNMSKDEINLKLLTILENNIANTKDLIVFSPGLLEFCAGTLKKEVTGEEKESITLNESSILPGRINNYLFPNKNKPIYTENNKTYLEKILSNIEIDIQYSENITDGTLITGILSEIKQQSSKSETFRMFVSDFLLFSTKKEYQNTMTDIDYFKFNTSTSNSFFPPYLINRKKILIPAKEVYELVHSPINNTLGITLDIQDVEYTGKTNEINWYE